VILAEFYITFIEKICQNTHSCIHQKTKNEKKNLQLSIFQSEK